MSGTASMMARGRTRHDELAIQLWQDWRRYLTARQALLDARSAQRGDLADAFEQGDTSAEEQERGARAQIAAIPAAYRLVCDQHVEARRQQLQAEREQAARAQAAGGRPEVVDPDQVERDALAQLLDEAEGRASQPGLPAGWGLVPSGDGDQVWAVNVPQIRAAPARAAYELGSDDELDVRRRLIQTGLLLLAGVIAILVWFIWPKGGAGPRLADQVISPVVNGRPADPWGLRRAVLTQANGEETTLPISPTLRLDPWPAVVGTGPASQAYARQASIWPLQLCVPAPLLQGLTQVQLDGLGQAPDRVYTVSATAERPDLVIEPCEGARGASLARYGIFQAMAPARFHALGEPVALQLSAGEPVELELTGATITGPGQSPALPADRAEVELRVRAGGGIDFPALAPGLLLPSGEVVQASIAAGADGVTALRYSVPLPTASLEVAWGLSLPDGSSARWRLTLDPPPSREAVIWQALALGEITASRDALGGEVLHVTLRNQGETPLQLLASDIKLIQGSTSLPVGEIAALREPLAPGAQRVIDLPLPPQAGSAPLVLSIGGTRARLTLGSPAGATKGGDATGGHTSA